jgi:hypothetical protein
VVDLCEECFDGDDDDHLFLDEIIAEHFTWYIDLQASGDYDHRRRVAAQIRSSYKRWHNTPVISKRSGRCPIPPDPSWSEADRARHFRYWQKYKITLFEYQAVFELQKGLCLLCQQPPSTTVL